MIFCIVQLHPLIVPREPEGSPFKPVRIIEHDDEIDPDTPRGTQNRKRPWLQLTPSQGSELRDEPSQSQPPPTPMRSNKSKRKEREEEGISFIIFIYFNSNLIHLFVDSFDNRLLLRDFLMKIL